MTVLGYEERRDDNGRRVKTDTTKDYKVQLVNEFEAAESVARPFAYLVPATFRQAVETLQRHGLNVEELREDIELDVEAYKVRRGRNVAAAVRPARVGGAARHAARRRPGSCRPARWWCGPGSRWDTWRS